MANGNRTLLRALHGVAACISMLGETADGAIAHRDVDWPVRADGLVTHLGHRGTQGVDNLLRELVVGMLGESASTGASPGGDAGLGSLGRRTFSAVGLMSDAGNLRYGRGRIDMGAIATNRTTTEIVWQDTPDTGFQASQTPAAGPLVLLGIATLVGGPRRERLARPSTGRPAA